jgi:tRNA nucleotidyltransferase (CCA-adding enzyme)
VVIFVQTLFFAMCIMSEPSVLLGFQVDDVVKALPSPIQVFLVGGAVRDHVMGRPVHDRDWVVVGATVEAMLAAGFMPVGAGFPVFLHPNTKEEYALARTERKSGYGYKGFTFHADPGVSLEEDLARRDFTINAMALDASGRLIDPYGGLLDVRAKTFRHVSPAFVEDPLRVLRLARFLARFVDFQVHPDTWTQCVALRDSGELAHLVPERVFVELHRGLGENKPSAMLEFLAQLEVWPNLVPEMQVPFAMLDTDQLAVLDRLTEAWERWAYGLGCCWPNADIKALARVLHIPNEISELAQVVAYVDQFVQAKGVSVEMLSRLFNRIDVYRKPARAQQALELLSRVSGSTPALAVIELAVSDLNHEVFKQGLRRYLSQKQGAQQPAEQVQAFKLHWVGELIARGTQNGLKNWDN